MTEAEIYKNKIKRQIRQGVLPRYFLAKGPDGQLERAGRKNRLTWRQISTLLFLTKEAPVETPIS